MIHSREKKILHDDTLEKIAFANSEFIGWCEKGLKLWVEEGKRNNEFDAIEKTLAEFRGDLIKISLHSHH